MPNDNQTSWGRGDRVDPPLASSELEQLKPFLELAREIKRDVERVAGDDFAGAEAISEVFERFTHQERERVVRDVYDRLPVEAQWSIIERVFDDPELRDHLAAERAALLAEVHRSERLRPVLDLARAELRLDTRMVPPGERLTLGLFRELDVAAAVTRGRNSDTCARRLVLRCIEPGAFRVIEDVFNPRGGYFVTREYDEQTWLRERLPAHSMVRVGSCEDDPAPPTLEPFLDAGGRVDVETDQGIIRGPLHLGFVVLGDRDVFAA